MRPEPGKKEPAPVAPELRMTPPGEVSQSNPPLVRPSTFWALALGAGALAGVGSWLAGEMTYDYFAPHRIEAEILGSVQSILTPEALAASGTQKGTLGAALLGAATGLCLGLAGGIARRSARAGLIAGAAGLVVGAVMAIAAAQGLLPIFFRKQDPISGDLILPMLIHLGIWIPAGLAGGLALGFGLGGRDRVLRAGLGGMAGAALGTVLFEVVGAMAFPHDATDQPVSASWATRLLAKLLVAVLAAVGAAMAVQARGRRAGAESGASPLPEPT